MPEGQTITARISISRSQLHRLAAVAMNPVTRAAIASATVALDRAAWYLYNGGGRAAEVRLDFVEQRVSAIGDCIRTLGPDARWSESPTPLSGAFRPENRRGTGE